MGGCATKPKVLKNEPKPLEGEAEEAEPQKPSLVQETETEVVVLDDIDDKRHSLSSLFHQNQNEQDAKINDATTRDASSESQEEAKFHDTQDVSEESKTKEIIIKQESLSSQEVVVIQEEESEKIKGAVDIAEIQNNEEKTEPEEEEKLEAENVSEEKESHQNIQNEEEEETTVADVAVVEKVIQVVESELEQKSQSIEVEAKSVNDVREGP